MIGRDWALFRTDNNIPFSEQKERLIYYSDKLLTWAEQGLYFVIEKE